MVLSDKTILEELEKGNVIIEPFNREHLNPCSIDLTIAPEYKIYNFHILDCKKENPVTEGVIPPEGMILQTGRVYLYRCNERIGCKGKIRAKCEGKSSLGRLGLFVHVTAGFIDVGFEGSLVLELVATQPIRIYPNQKICQIEFAYTTTEPLESYGNKKGSKYMNQEGVVESKMFQNF